MDTRLNLVETDATPTKYGRELNLDQLAELALEMVSTACPQLTGQWSADLMEGTRLEQVNVGILCGNGALLVSARAARKSLRGLVRAVKAARLLSTIEPLVPGGVLQWRVVRHPKTNVTVRLVAAHAGTPPHDVRVIVRIDVLGRVKA